MTDRIEDFVGRPVNTKEALRLCLYGGGWWALCRTLVTASTADPAVWLAGLPPADGLQNDALETWRLMLPIGALLDPPNVALSATLLRTMAVQMHLVQIALQQAKGWTAPDAVLPLHETADPDRPADLAPLATTIARTPPELAHWLRVLLTGDGAGPQQEIAIPWIRYVSDRAGAGGQWTGSIATLMLTPAEDAASDLFAHPAGALVQVAEPFERALLAGWVAARAALAQTGLPWPAGRGLAWRLDWGTQAPLARLDGPGAGAAMALAASLLGQRLALAQGRADGAHGVDARIFSPLLDPDAVRGLAVGAAVPDGHQGCFGPVAQFALRVQAVLWSLGTAPLHTLVVAADQPLAEAAELGFGAEHPDEPRVLTVTDPATGRRCDLVRARDLADAIEALGPRLGRRWERTGLYGGPVTRLLQDELGNTDRPRPFGGRAEALHDLDAWLADADHPCGLVLGPPGGGKTRLLGHWVSRLWLRPDLGLVYLPIGGTAGISQPGDIADLLLDRLACLHGESPLAEGRAASVEQRLEQVAQSLRRPLPDGRTLVLVIDGLDAGVWTPAEHIFPAEPRAGIRVLVAARPLAGGLDAGGWRDRLGWYAARTRILDLPPLDRAGVSEALGSLGLPPAVPAARTDLLEALLAQTGGDPLRLGWLMEELAPRLSARPELPVTDLAQLVPGLRDHLRQWWQAETARDPRLQQAESLALLTALARADDPLARDALLQRAGLSSVRQLRHQVLPLVARWVTGDGVAEGYRLGYPALAQILREDLSPDNDIGAAS